MNPPLLFYVWAALMVVLVLTPGVYDLGSRWLNARREKRAAEAYWMGL